MNTAVIVARFQTPYLHEGHKDLINQVTEKHKKLIIVLGMSPVSGRRNPFDFYTRERMIKKEYPNAVVLPLGDHPSDKQWSKNLDELLSAAFPTERFVLYGSRDSFIPYYSGVYKTVNLTEHGEFNATTLRNEHADLVLDSPDFRAGILYALAHQYDKVYPTVDIAMFRDSKKEILLARKSTSEQWRLIGGFADPEDDNFACAAKRELIEECGEVVVSEMQYETSSKIDDWRYRPEVDKIITTLFSCDMSSGALQAQDDIEEVKWFRVSELPLMLKSSQLSAEHHVLYNHLINKYNH